MIDDQSLINSLIKSSKELDYKDDGAKDALRRRSQLIIRKVFGESSHYLNDLELIRFLPSAYSSSNRDDAFRKAWQKAQTEMFNLFSVMLEDVQMRSGKNESQLSISQPIESSALNGKVFIVHGHDGEMKQAVARTLEQLGLEHVILHEQPDRGKTVIEKFLSYAQVSSFAIVLLSPDDLAYDAKMTADKAKYRARQNVILELGFFLGKLGRERVVVLFRHNSEFELPSDFAGVLYKSFDSDTGSWRLELVNELKECGYEVDTNRLH